MSSYSLRTHPEWRIIVRGHTDADGTTKQNHSLSKARATFVVQHMYSEGIPLKRIIIRPFGENIPIADNKTIEGKRLNRRVDFELIKQVLAQNQR